MKRFAGLSKLALITLGVLALLVATVSLFGNNIRRLFGAHAQALVGEEYAGNSGSRQFQRKSLKTFGENEADDGPSPTFAAPAPAPARAVAAPAQEG